MSEVKRHNAYFVVVDGPHVGHIYHLNDGRFTIGRHKDSALVLHNPQVSRRHAEILRMGPTEFLLRDIGSDNGTFCNGVRIREETTLQYGDLIRVGDCSLAMFTYRDNLENTVQQQMFASVTHDPLTQCYNRCFFEEQLTNDMLFAVRHKRSLSLLMMSIDGFAELQQRHERHCVDAVLQYAAHTLKKTARRADILAHYRAGEFMIILREADPEAAVKLAERAQEALSHAAPVYNGRVIPISMHYGIGSYTSGDETSPELLLGRAVADLFHQTHAA